MTNNQDDQLWYKDAVIYELHIKAFRDSNGDGVGDFGGLMEKLDYLQELGVTAIWVLPFYPSPLKDDGYDIADYYTINQRYGNVEQFKAFLEEAHKRHLKVITELVINHTSDQHPWFQRARSAPKGSPERDFYVWTDDPTQYRDVRIIFQDFESSNWTWDPVAQQYYWHRFFHHQPDLNYDNEMVHEEVFKVIDFWCAMGVDGFRLDAVPYLYEREGTNGENLPETHEFLKKLRKHVDEKFPGTVFLAEANMWPEDSASYFGNGDECHMNYHFPVMPRMFMALQQEDRYPITDIFDQTPEIPENCQWAIFLRNHDELTLEMVTDEERDFMYKTYAKDPKARINLGIRHRLAPLMDNNRRKIELMNSLLFSLPGTPVIYYGDEIGMGDNFYLGDRDGVRTPMQWSADRNAGFSESNPHMLYLPVILDPEYSYESINVEMQRRNTSSLFWYMKRIISIRKKFKAFGRGDLKFLNVENPKVLAFTRSYQGETILVISNLSKYSQPAEVDLREFRGYQLVEMFSKNPFPPIKDDPYFFTLNPHSYHWFTLKKVLTKKEAERELPFMEFEDLQAVTTGAFRKVLEEDILPAYLPTKKWFKGRKRTVYSIAITDHLPVDLGHSTAEILQVEVAYESGLPEYYQLAVYIIVGQPAKTLAEDHPDAVIGTVSVGRKKGYLVDAFYLPSFHEFLMRELVEGKGGPGPLLFTNNNGLEEYLKATPGIKTRMHAGDINSTSITYDGKYFLKMFRKIEPGVHPDVEINKLLTQTAFPYTPRFIGLIQWQNSSGMISLGMLQEMVENHGTGHSYLTERLNNYMERILARDRQTLDPSQRVGSLTDPKGFDELPEDLQTLLGTRAADFMQLLGKRTADMHLALLKASTSAEMKPEDFSLHYQRSLFSSMQSLVRESYGHLHKVLGELPAFVQEEADPLVGKRNEMLSHLKAIYAKKIDVAKIRVHGSYELHKVLLTGKDLAIQDFGGDPYRSFSERRIRRSALLDIAHMIASIYAVSFEAFYTNNQLAKTELKAMLPFADQWAFFMSGFFMKKYLETMGETPLLPSDKEDLRVVLETFLVEKALNNLNYELERRPEWVIWPLRLLKSILKVDG